MLHISWWFLLLGLGIYAIYFLGGLISILIMYLVDIIVKVFKFKTKLQAEKILNFFEKNNDKFFKSFFILTIICLVVIPLNNLVYYFKCDNENKSLRISKNKQFIENKNYHFYKIIAPSNQWVSADFYHYYTFSTDSIENIKELKFIKINKKIYVKPLVIVELTKEEFLEKTKDIILEEEFKNE